MKKLVIFDLDGTLFDTLNGLYLSLNKALCSCDLPSVSLQQTKQFVGDGAYNLCKRAVNGRLDKLEECYNSFMSIYSKQATNSTTLFSGIEGLLKKLNEYKLKIAIFSNKPHQATVDICNALLKNVKIDYVLGHKEGAPLKPNKAGVEQILSALNVSAEDTVFVGDGETDVKTALNSNVDFIGVTWGFRTKKQLKSAGCKLFAKNPDHLENLILYQFGRKKMKKLFNEFKAFIAKGNVLDMAVGVIIGSAFSAIVNSLVKDVITPVISIITGGKSLAEACIILKPAELDAEGNVLTAAITINYGTFIETIINFLLIAITVFLFVKIVMGIKRSLDINENMRKAIQEKLDKDEPLNKLEEKWMARQAKKDPANLPAKKVVEPAAPPAPAEPSSTDKLLMQILDQLKQNNQQ